MKGGEDMNKGYAGQGKGGPCFTVTAPFKKSGGKDPKVIKGEDLRSGKKK